MIFTIDNHFQLVRIFFNPLHVFVTSRNGKYRGSIKYNMRDLIFGFSWISCINCNWGRSSWFSRLKTVSNLYVNFFDLLIVFIMSRNGKYRDSVKYNIGDLIFEFSWINCINCFKSRTSWYSLLKTIFNLSVFFLIPLNNFFMTWNGKNWRSAKYNIGVLIFEFSWISCIYCFSSRTSWFPCLKTISNLYVFFFIHIMFSSRVGMANTGGL